MTIGLVLAVAAAVGVGLSVLPSEDTDGKDPAAPRGADSAAETTIAPPGGSRVVATSPYSVTIAWTPPSERRHLDRYRVYRDGKPVGTADEPRFLDEGLRPGTEYTYTVTAVFDGIESTPSPSIVARTDQALLSEARLDGDYRIVFRITSEYGWTDISAGERSGDRWTLSARCAKGACETRVSATLWTWWNMVLERAGAAYTGTTHEQISMCGATNVTDTIALELTVTKADVVDGVWTATAFEGTLRRTSPSVMNCTSSSLSGPVTGIRR